MAGIPTQTYYQKVATGDGSTFNPNSSALQAAFTQFKDGDKGLLQMDMAQQMIPHASSLATHMQTYAGSYAGINVQQDATTVGRINTSFTSAAVDPTATKKNDTGGMLSWLGDNVWVIFVVLAILIIVMVIAFPEILAGLAISAGPAILLGLGFLIAAWVLYKIVSSALDALGIPQTALPFILVGGLMLVAMMMSGSKKKDRPQIVVVNQTLPYGQQYPYV